MGKKTLVLGASPKPDRYSNRAILSLVEHGHEVVAIGRREATVGKVTIVKGLPELLNIHTVTMYLSPPNQEEYLDYILKLKPKRIIFNPGTWNPKLSEEAEKIGIEVENDCTLIMVSSGCY
ncbi:MAG TPA: CoA-binding protein [Bacteroidales bacterium]|nr:CoA-binding protein [Bacteroidales bacterium]